MVSPLHAMLLFRIIFLVLIIKSILTGSWDSVVMDLSVFLATLALPLFGGKKYYYLDAYIMFVFIVAALSPLWGVNMYDSGMFSWDKLFHLMGGFGLGWFGLIIYGKKLKKELLWMSVILLVVALGAMWEMFEWVLWQLPGPFKVITGGHTDTILDIVADTLGGVVALFVLRK